MISPHLVSIFPKGALDNPDDILNLRIPRFDAEDIYAGYILQFPETHIPELSAKLYPPTPGQPTIRQYIAGVLLGSKVTLHLRDVTVRDILNAASIASGNVSFEDLNNFPCGWLYRIRTKDGQPIPQFVSISTLPFNWKDLRKQLASPGPDAR